MLAVGFPKSLRPSEPTLSANIRKPVEPVSKRTGTVGPPATLTLITGRVPAGEMRANGSTTGDGSPGDENVLAVELAGGADDDWEDGDVPHALTVTATTSESGAVNAAEARTWRLRWGSAARTRSAYDALTT
mgnify:CR=1 FL=1